MLQPCVREFGNPHLEATGRIPIRSTECPPASSTASLERRRVRRALERYCGQDTQAMIDIVRALRTLVGAV